MDFRHPTPSAPRGSLIKIKNYRSALRRLGSRSQQDRQLVLRVDRHGHEPLRLLGRLGPYCGLRPTEYLALRWRDVDLDGGVLRVMQNIRQDGATDHMGQKV